MFFVYMFAFQLFFVLSSYTSITFFFTFVTFQYFRTKICNFSCFSFQSEQLISIEDFQPIVSDLFLLFATNFSINVSVTFSFFFFLKCVIFCTKL